MGAVNDAANKLVEIFHRAGESMRRDPIIRRVPKKHYCPDKVWWHIECSNSKRNKQRLLRIFRASRSQDDLHNYLESKKCFKLLCSKKQFEYRKVIYRDLRESTHCSTSVWSCLNKIKKQNHTNSQIPSETWFNHFTGLLNNANVKNIIFEENIT